MRYWREDVRRVVEAYLFCAGAFYDAFLEAGCHLRHWVHVDELRFLFPEVQLLEQVLHRLFLVHQIAAWLSLAC
jgi:hypothetical protein